MYTSRRQCERLLALYHLVCPHSAHFSAHIQPTFLTFGPLYYSFPSEMEHSLNITASSSSPVLAGSTLTLTCTAVTDRVPHLKWIGPVGLVTSGDGITVSEQVDGVTTSVITLTFDPL